MAGSAAERPDKRPATLLVVEDERMVREVVSAILERAGYRVVACNGGEAAIRAMTERAGGIDAVLLDMELPGMHGEEVLRRLREMKPDLPIVLTSGHDKERYTRQLIVEPKVAFVQKPYQPKDLAELLRVLLEE